jgi:hypothetical protein
MTLCQGLNGLISISHYTKVDFFLSLSIANMDREGYFVYDGMDWPVPCLETPSRLSPTMYMFTQDVKQRLTLHNEYFRGQGMNSSLVFGDTDSLFFKSEGMNHDYFRGHGLSLTPSILYMPSVAPSITVVGNKRLIDLYVEDVCSLPSYQPMIIEMFICLNNTIEGILKGLNGVFKRHYRHIKRYYEDRSIVTAIKRNTIELETLRIFMYVKVIAKQPMCDRVQLTHPSLICAVPGGGEIRRLFLWSSRLTKEA